MKVRTILATAGAGALLAAGIILPAHADNTYPYLEICNSVNSRGTIKIVNLVNETSGGYVTTGACKLYYNADNRIRVDPDPELGTADVDSTWWGYEGQGLDYCDPGEGLIDPPNYYTGYIKYNTDASGC